MSSPLVWLQRTLDTTPATGADVVVLLSEDGAGLGTADRRVVHTAQTPLHLAFSSYLFDAQGRVLLTRRALAKLTWPGVWTNSCCGHPKPGETFTRAIEARISFELGAAVTDLTPALPAFRYRAVDASGVVENEICPVFLGRLGPGLKPNPDEVMDHEWVAWADLVAAVAAVPSLVSPWAALQIPALDDGVREWLGTSAQR